MSRERELLAEVVKCLEFYGSISDQLMQHAKAILAQPEAEPTLLDDINRLRAVNGSPPIVPAPAAGETLETDSMLTFIGGGGSKDRITILCRRLERQRNELRAENERYRTNYVTRLAYEAVKDENERLRKILEAMK